MYRLLIVDDEVHVVDWLYELFRDIEHIEFDIYKAYSATSALEWMKISKIDIIITDINMPKMNGLQLVERIRTDWPECRVIFLTGYNEFEYAQKAIQNDAIGYVLKADDDEELIKAVKKAVKQIEDSRRIEEVTYQAKQRIKTARLLLQREFATTILEGGYTDTIEMQKQFDELEIPMRADYPLFLLVGRVDDKTQIQSYVKRHELIYSIDAVCTRFLCASVTCFLLILDSNNMVWFIQPSDLKSNLVITLAEDKLSEKTALFVRETLEIIQTACRETLGTSISFVFGIEPVTWEKIEQKHFELKSFINYNMGLGSEMLMTDKSFSTMRDQSIPIDTSIKDARSRLSKLGAMGLCLEKGRKDEFHLILDEITKYSKNVKVTNSNMALEIYFSISLIFLTYINRRNLTQKIAFRTGLNKLMRIEEHSSWDEAMSYLHNIADIIFDIQSNEEDIVVSDAISKVKEYICNHLSEDLSLVKLANLVYFNPSYLSRLFKQVTGNNLTNSILNMKIDKAKQLLEDRNLKIREVASAVGYDSSTYFAKFFKKMTGLNPQDYRDSI